jgi:radical SAM protein with 4Fe4S-binding SPASM domain
MSICSISMTEKFDLRQGTVEEGWDQFLQPIRERKKSRVTKCTACHLKSACGMCPANAELENGDAETPVEFLCHVAHLRAELFEWNVPAHGECEFCEGGIHRARVVEGGAYLRRRLEEGTGLPLQPMLMLPSLGTGAGLPTPEGLGTGFEAVDACPVPRLRTVLWLWKPAGQKTVKIPGGPVLVSNARSLREAFCKGSAARTKRSAAQRQVWAVDSVGLYEPAAARAPAFPRKEGSSDVRHDSGKPGAVDSANSFCLQVADVRILVRSGQAGPTFRIEGPSQKFLVNPEIHAEVTLDVSWGDLTLDTPGPLVFDSGGTWRLHEEPDGRLGFRFFSSNTGSSPYLVMRLASDARTGTLTLHEPFYPPDAPLDPLQFPVDEVLMVQLLGHGLGVELHACGVVAADGKGYLFAGQSGDGKTTTARLWDGRPGVHQRRPIVVRRRRRVRYVRNAAARPIWLKA